MNPGKFGREEFIDWVPYRHPAPHQNPQVKAEQDREYLTWQMQLGAAQLQHAYAYRIRERLADHERNVAYLAHRIGANEQRWRRVLAGQVLMRLEDVALAQALLGEVSDDLE